MKILNNGRLCGGMFIFLCLFGCATNPELAATKPTNLFNRSSIEIKDYKFFRAANPSDFTSCVKDNLLDGMCERREMAAGEPFDALQFSVSIKDRSAWASESIRDYSMYLTGVLSNKLGYDYFTTINISNIGTCSTIPSAYSSGRFDSYGNYYGTTAITNNTSCSNLYTATFLAFKNYDPIKHGILVKYLENRKPTLHYDLYFGIADRIEATKSGNPSALEYYQYHPINAWKYYFPSTKTVQAAVAKYGLAPNPDVMAIVKKERAGAEGKDLRKELIIRGQ
jgi:hypothetical protein